MIRTGGGRIQRYPSNSSLSGVEKGGHIHFSKATAVVTVAIVAVADGIGFTRKSRFNSINSIKRAPYS